MSFASALSYKWCRKQLSHLLLWVQTATSLTNSTAHHSLAQSSTQSVPQLPTLPGETLTADAAYSQATVHTAEFHNLGPFPRPPPPSPVPPQGAAC